MYKVVKTFIDSSTTMKIVSNIDGFIKISSFFTYQNYPVFNIFHYPYILTYKLF